ncbi:MAG: hypothetical protein ACRD7E_07880 [Bryobacteraceae bacterium]
MQIETELAAAAIEEGLQKYPAMSRYGPALVWRPLLQGGALMVQYAEQPPRGHPDAWEFQNAVVKSYRRLTGQ